MNRLVRPVCFAYEADVVSVFGVISFGAAGAPTLAVGTSTQSNNVPQNKGICNIALNTISFTATVDGTTAVLTAVSSFAGLYNGMSVTGTGIAANSKISSMNPGAGTITLNNNTTASGTAVALSASGGQYVITFGSQFTPFKRLDTYVRLLQLTHLWDESALQGGASTGASSPAAPTMILVGNQIAVAGQASLTIQLGTLAAGVFVATNPASGEVLRIAAQLTRSTAI